MASRHNLGFKILRINRNTIFKLLETNTAVVNDRKFGIQDTRKTTQTYLQPMTDGNHSKDLEGVRLNDSGRCKSLCIMLVDMASID